MNHQSLENLHLKRSRKHSQTRHLNISPVLLNFSGFSPLQPKDLCRHNFGHHVVQSVLEHGHERHRKVGVRFETRRFFLFLGGFWFGRLRVKLGAAQFKWQFLFGDSDCLDTKVLSIWKKRMADSSLFWGRAVSKGSGFLEVLVGLETLLFPLICGSLIETARCGKHTTTIW